MTHERRKTPRRDVDVPAHLRLGEGTLDVRVHDICRDAALVEADSPVEVGTGVGLILALPGLSAPIELRGNVIRTAVGEKRAHALAVLFDDVPPGDATRIDFFVALHDERAAAGSGTP